MTITSERVATHTLSLPEELILMLLNQESGYFHQVPGWDLNCAVIGAVLGELSLSSRVDTDMDSLFILDPKETGDPVLDPILKEISDGPAGQNAQFWIERLAPHAEEIIDKTLERLVDLNILEHHDGDFWTLAGGAEHTELFKGSRDGIQSQFVKTRISRAIFENEIPHPRDVIIICLVNTCDVFRFMFQLDEAAEERIEFICNMDLIGRSIAAAVAQNLAGPLLRRSALSKEIPPVSLRKVLFSPNLRNGNIPALFAELAREYGPVFQIRAPFAQPMIILAGPDTNHWVHRRGRMYLRTRDYFADFEKVYGASGVLPSLDGADHFRLRKSLGPAYSRGRLEGELDQLYRHVRTYVADWSVGDTLPATTMCRRMVNAQLSPLFVSVDSQDIFDDLATYKERALMTHVLKIMPKFMLKTPGMKRRWESVEALLERVQNVHTSAQRSESSRNLADDLLSMHASDPQFVPGSRAYCQRVSGRCLQLCGLRHGVSAGPVPHDPG